MKAFLLAGGKGERLRPLTDSLPKCLVPINGVPLLQLWLDHCAAEGITDVLLNVSQHVGLVEDFLARRAGAPRVRLVAEDVPRGTAGTVIGERWFVDDVEDFWVIYSDNLTDVRLGPMLNAHRNHDGLVTLGLFRAPDPRAVGIVDLDADGRILRFTEKPSEPASDLANAGIYLARRQLVDELPTGRTLLDFGHDVFPALAGRLWGYVIPEFLMDIGTPTALERAARAWRERTAPGRHS
jgi:mannose-1-phosphate guanylyltransferase